MDKKLYLIANSGCDATTHGLVRFTDEEFSIFKENVENLNRNSTYGCMPTISVFLIKEENINEINYNPSLMVWDEGYYDRSDILFLEDRAYILDKNFNEYVDAEKVI